MAEMSSDFLQGFVLGLAMQPLYVTTGADIVKFGAHNLLADCTFNSTFGVQIVGENVTVNVPADLSVAWYTLTNSNITFKHNYMYKLEAVFRGYGRIGISTTSNNPFAEIGMHTSGTKDDNYLVGANGSSLACFYVHVRRKTIGDGTQTAGFWFCSDELYESTRAAHSFQIALYEEEKKL